MAKKIVKVNEKTVAVVEDLRRIYSKEQLELERPKLVQRIADIDELLAVFTA